MARKSRSEGSLQKELVLSFCHAGPSGYIQVVSGWQMPLPMSYLADPGLDILMSLPLLPKCWT